jgi:hypothetical protein
MRRSRPIGREGGAVLGTRPESHRQSQVWEGGKKEKPPLRTRFVRRKYLTECEVAVKCQIDGESDAF